MGGDKKSAKKLAKKEAKKNKKQKISDAGDKDKAFKKQKCDSGKSLPRIVLPNVSFVPPQVAWGKVNVSTEVYTVSAATCLAGAFFLTNSNPGYTNYNSHQSTGCRRVDK